jgi:hypothetical protein
MNEHLQSDQSTIWIIDVCAFFLKILTVWQYLFLQKFLESPKKPFIVIRKKFEDFFSITPKPKNDHVTVYSRNKVGKNSTVFFQQLLKSIFGKSEEVL